jgi:alpha-galactosidase
MTDDVRAILTAPEPIAVDQDPLGRQGDLVRAERSGEIWARELADGGRAVVLFNRSKRAEEIVVRWTDLGWGLQDRVLVRDLWERTDRGVRAEAFAMTVPTHGAAMLRLTPERPV